MTPAVFLATVWPDAGPYCFATPFRTPDGASVYRHITFDTVEEAAAYAEKVKHQVNLFFSVHSLNEHKVWNPEKEDRKTGTPGAYEVRVQRNMQAAQCFFFDLDVGESTTRGAKYGSQEDALRDLKRFCDETSLPRPMIVSSGGGLHVYWLLTESIPSTEWKTQASKLRQLARHHGLKADPARTTDTASVLRVAGSYNLKDPDNPRKVRVMKDGKRTANGQFIKLLDDAIIRAGITLRPVVPVAFDELGSNIEDTFDGPPVTMKALITACPQMQRQARLKGNVSEPEWYHTINLVRFVENGRAMVHKISAGHPNYDAAQTDAKLTQLETKGIKPTSCLKLAEVAGDEPCEGCPFLGKVKSPLVAARRKDPAPAPIITTHLGNVSVTTEVPPPPYPFIRMKGGGIAVHTKTKDGDEADIVIYPHDLHPVRRLVNSSAEVEQQTWRVTLPREGAKDFILDADALYDRRKFVVAISNQGIYPQPNHLLDLQEYMIAYISELQRLNDAETQCNHLGWTEKNTQFIMPDRILMPDGSAKPAQLSLGASRASQQVLKEGTLEKQVELMSFYNFPAYIPNQFYILASLAAPIFFATGHHGVIVNASGDAGASKSTSLYTAASLWGQPEMYPINGTNNGATMKARNERVSTLANLPVCVDEITHLPVKDAIDLAMGITQPGHRLRLEQVGVERNSTGSYKATMMLTTANNSLHGLLSTDNAAGTAGSMRVFEIVFKAGVVHKKHEADDYWHELKQNFGHIGEVFIAYVVQNREQVIEQVRKTMREVDEAVKIVSAERFWSATIAAVLVAGEVAKELGLIPYDMAAIRQWALKRQIPYMRGIVMEEYSNPLSILSDYLETISGNILVMHKQGNIPQVVPRHQLLARYDAGEGMMWVLKKGFKDYCIRIGANYFKVISDLETPQLNAAGHQIRIIPHRNMRKVLGAGTELAKAQSWCFAINMNHPEVSGVVDLSTIINNAPATTPPKGKLRAVE